MLFKRYILLIIIFFYSFPCFAQLTVSEKSGLGLEADYGYGFIMPHHKMIEYFIEDHIQTLDIKLNKATYGEKYWNQLFRYPYYGIGFYRANLGNNEVYGFANALYSYVKVPLLGRWETANLSWQIGFGASYLTKHFDIKNNPKNLAIGSNLNIYADFSLQSQIPLSPKINLINNVRFSHFSNGKIKSPNRGLNVISGSIGLLYHFKEPQIKYHMELPDIENKNEYSIIYAGGIKTKSRYE
ncbi:MAG TPA: acyloxyacyl hydrolase, partial [Bacteroidales bacterium]|nr:acyloxyacyl hydrolase [Bacteroidales bacterium]